MSSILRYPLRSWIRRHQKFGAAVQIEQEIFGNVAFKSPHVDELRFSCSSANEYGTSPQRLKDDKLETADSQSELCQSLTD